MWDDNIYGTNTAAAGPQMDGTVITPVTVTNPVDSGGGLPAQYGSAVLDVFKWGVGVWQGYQGQKDLLDYRRWETTQQGAVQQGQAAAQYATAQAQAQSNSTLLLIGGGVLLAVLLLRKG